MQYLVAVPVFSPVAMRVGVSLLVSWVLCASAAPAAAHRLDEYLQATRISIGVDAVDVEMDLTAGASAASTVFASIDHDGDGQLSQAECADYGRAVVTSALLEADGQRTSLTLTSSECPTFADMSGGVGTIRLTARAQVTRSAGRHVLYFRNTHRADLGAYLVNALVPASREVIITGQRRDEWQHEFWLDYTSARRKWELTGEQFGWLAVATMLAGVLCYSRLRLTAAARTRETTVEPA